MKVDRRLMKAFRKNPGFANELFWVKDETDMSKYEGGVHLNWQGRDALRECVEDGCILASSLLTLFGGVTAVSYSLMDNSVIDSFSHGAIAVGVVGSLGALPSFDSRGEIRHYYVSKILSRRGRIRRYQDLREEALVRRGK